MKHIKFTPYMALFRFFCVLLFSSFFVAAKAQTFGGNPARTQWRQVNNEAVKVIYPEGMDSVANRVAAVSLHLQQLQEKSSLGQKHHKYSIVLQKDVNNSNAYVMMGPRRSEFFMMPPQNPLELGSMSWADNLAIHEYRHVQQYNNFNVGVSSAAGAIFGQYGQAIANALSVPDWFFEGDAVWNETVRTKQGRGRLPLFLNAYNSIDEKGSAYSYMKMRNGSLRHYVPNHYELGYLLVSYGRQQYGDDFWTKVTKDAASFKPLLYPFQGAVKKHSGKSFNIFVQNAMEDFRSKQQALKINVSPQWLTAVNKHAVTNYKYPYPTADGNIILLKSGYDHLPTFMQIDSLGKETKIGVKDISFDDYFSYNNGRIVYSAFKADARWGNRDYSIISMMYTATGERYNVTKQGRYFSPDINTTGDQVVAVATDPATGSRLEVMNTEGEVLHATPNDASLFFSHPKFLSNEKEVLVAARQQDGQMGWMIWNFELQTREWLLKPAQHLLAFPVVTGDTIYYTHSEAGFDALFAIRRSNGKRWQVQAYTTGVYQGYVKNKEVYASFFTADGYRMGKTTFHTPTEGLDEPELKLLYQQQAGYDAIPTTSSSLTTSRYRKFSHPFNFHSWQPEISEAEYTARLFGNNVLNTTLTELFYTYNRNETSHTTGANWRYGGWFVQPLVGVKHTFSREVFYNADTTFSYQESEAYAGVFLPLNFTKGRLFRSLNFTSTVNTDRLRWQGIGKGLLRDLDFVYWSNRIAYTSQIQKTIQQIYPRFAQAIIADYRTMVSDRQAAQLLVSGSFFLPGLSKNHSLVLSAAWQARDTMQQYAFSNAFPFSRGYRSVNFPRMFRFGANYHFPLFYPDWGLGNIVYFQRIRANTFYDYTRVKSLRTGATRSFTTLGVEVYADSRWWNQLPVSIGIRYSYLLNNQFSGITQPHQWEVILPVNIF